MSIITLIEAAIDPGRQFHAEDERAWGKDDHHNAAVLIPITNRSEPGVILTQRREDLRNHAGQVAFPGGKIDAGDKDEIAAALREADEELAISPADVTIIGISDIYYSGSGYRITPVIGLIPPDLDLRPNPGEVEDWFEVPLALLLNPGNFARRSALWKGRERQYYEMTWQGRRIWGVTAGIIVNLARRMNAI